MLGALTLGVRAPIHNEKRGAEFFLCVLALVNALTKHHEKNSYWAVSGVTQLWRALAYFGNTGLGSALLLLRSLLFYVGALLYTILIR